MALARQSTVYDLSLRGVEVSGQWKLEAHDEPLQRSDVAGIEQPLQLVTALAATRRLAVVGRAAGSPAGSRGWW